VKYLRALAGFLLAILWALTLGWILALIELVRELCARLRRKLRSKRLPGRIGRISPQRCVRISDPAYKRPDPLIYDQYYLMSLGAAVTWDNPDIELRQGGAPVPSSALQPDTDYEIVARIWNASTEAPVVGLPVSFSYLSFGIGTQSHPIGSTKVDLGVKGGPGHPAFARHAWRTPATPGHDCIQVEFSWPDDLNPKNNLGQENTNVGTAHSPAIFELALRNDTERRQEYRFEADGYAIGELPPCEERDVERRRARLPDRIAVPRRHARGSHPLPAGWSVSFDPAQPDLDPGAEIPVRVEVTPPDGFRGRAPVNVHAFRGEGLAGGVTLYVERS
jgi:hypothetical protein